MRISVVHLFSLQCRDPNIRVFFSCGSRIELSVIEIRKVYPISVGSSQIQTSANEF